MELTDHLDRANTGRGDRHVPSRRLPVPHGL